MTKCLNQTLKWLNHTCMYLQSTYHYISKIFTNATSWNADLEHSTDLGLTRHVPVMLNQRLTAFVPASPNRTVGKYLPSPVMAQRLQIPCQNFEFFWLRIIQSVKSCAILQHPHQTEKNASIAISYQLDWYYTEVHEGYVQWMLRRNAHQVLIDIVASIPFVKITFIPPIKKSVRVFEWRLQLAITGPLWKLPLWNSTYSTFSGNCAPSPIQR